VPTHPKTLPHPDRPATTSTRPGSRVTRWSTCRWAPGRRCSLPAPSALQMLARRQAHETMIHRFTAESATGVSHSLAISPSWTPCEPATGHGGRAPATRKRARRRPFDGDGGVPSRSRRTPTGSAPTTEIGTPGHLENKPVPARKYVLRAHLAHPATLLLDDRELHHATNQPSDERSLGMWGVRSSRSWPRCGESDRWGIDSPMTGELLRPAPAAGHRIVTR